LHLPARQPPGDESRDETGREHEEDEAADCRPRLAHEIILIRVVSRMQNSLS
jgi:hypothetical protein